MIQESLQQSRLGYSREVLAQRWPAPSSIPRLLAVTRDNDLTAVTFGRLGFQVEEISADEPLEHLRQQLCASIATFDVICCWDLPVHREDCQDLTGVMARALRSGGVLFYSVSGRTTGGRRDLTAILRRSGLSAQPFGGLGHSVGFAFRGSGRPVLRLGAA